MLLPFRLVNFHAVFGIDLYEDENRNHWWFPLIKVCHSVLWKINKAYSWIEDRLIYRHHVIHTGLEPGWCDKDVVMFHACFAILGRFVEDELGRATVDLSSDEQYRGYCLHCVGGSDEEAIDLWLWYRDDLPKLRQEYWKNPRQWLIAHKEQGWQGIDDVEDQKLRQLINLRRTLWT